MKLYAETYFKMPPNEEDSVKSIFDLNNVIEEQGINHEKKNVFIFDIDGTLTITEHLSILEILNVLQ
jgi:hypothetical protein